MDDGEVRGIYVFDVRTVEEAEALTASDLHSGRAAGDGTAPLVWIRGAYESE